MKTIFILFCSIVSCLGQAFTWHDLAMVESQNSVAVSCSTYNTTNAFDNFIEGFEGVNGFESNGWSYVGTTANIVSNYDSSLLSTYKPDGACGHCLHVIAPADGTETYAIVDLGAAIDIDTIQTDVYISIYCETLPANGTAYEIFGYGNTSSPFSGAIYALNNAGTLQIQFVGVGLSSAINIAIGQWYVVKISLDIARAVNGSTMTVWSNGSQIGSVTEQRVNGDIRYLYLGAIFGLAASEGGTWDFDLLCIKTN